MFDPKELEERVVPVVPSPILVYVLHERDGTVAGERCVGQRLTPGEFFDTEDGRHFVVVDNVPPDHHFTDPRFDGYAVVLEA